MSFLKRAGSAASQSKTAAASSSSASAGTSQGPDQGLDTKKSASIELSASGAASLARAQSAADSSSVPASVLAAEADVAFYLQRIAKIVDEYQRLHRKALDLKKLPIPRNVEGIPYKKLRDQKAEVLTKRKELKEEFIRNKQLSRTVMKDRLPPERIGLRERELKGLQQSFREYDTGIKELDLLGTEGASKGDGSSGKLKSAGSASSGLAMLAGVDTSRSGASSGDASSGGTGGGTGVIGKSRSAVGKMFSVAGSAVASVLPITHASSSSAASQVSSVAVGGRPTPAAAKASDALDDDDGDAAAGGAAVIAVGEGGDDGDEEDELWRLPKAGSSRGAGGTGLGNKAAGGKGNTEYLADAWEIQKETLEKLQEGQRAIEQSKAVAGGVTETLGTDRETIERISGKLDEVQGELAISRKLLTNFVKRLYTDKLIIALTFLIVCAIVAIIIFATVKKDQKIFNVPDIVKPPLNPSSQQ